MGKKRGPLRDFPCPACNLTIVTTDSRQVFCSTLCGKRFYAVTQVRYTECHACGVVFTTHGQRWNVTACGDECRAVLIRRSAKRSWAANYENAKALARKNTALRRARLKCLPTETFSHEEVFERDHWSCHICHEKINPAHKRPHRLAAELDHIIPISQGGPHTLANVAASHAHCNKSKSNRPVGEQLRLVG